MNPDFQQLERSWIGAVQRQDKHFLAQVLDDAFVCTAWSSAGELTTREEYLASLDLVEFRCCSVELDHVQMLSDCAVVRCRLQCDCIFGERSWSASFLVTDVWAMRGSVWRALSRHASVPLADWPTILTLSSPKVSESAPPVDTYRAEGA